MPNFKKCPHLDCLVWHNNGSCDHDMSSYCGICQLQPIENIQLAEVLGKDVEDIIIE